ncbi:hypothetical protein [Vibrio splendidus]|nr:hypothetical protein [Vibrio splendidus]
MFNTTTEWRQCQVANGAYLTRIDDVVYVKFLKWNIAKGIY